VALSWSDSSAMGFCPNSFHTIIDSFYFQGFSMLEIFHGVSYGDFRWLCNIPGFW
jgi:hypothetical protein